MNYFRSLINNKAIQDPSPQQLRADLAVLYQESALRPQCKHYYPFFKLGKLLSWIIVNNHQVIEKQSFSLNDCMTLSILCRYAKPPIVTQITSTISNLKVLILNKILVAELELKMRIKLSFLVATFFLTVLYITLDISKPQKSRIWVHFSWPEI